MVNSNLTSPLEERYRGVSIIILALGTISFFSCISNPSNKEGVTNSTQIETNENSKVYDSICPERGSDYQGNSKVAVEYYFDIDSTFTDSLLLNKLEFYNLKSFLSTPVGEFYKSDSIQIFADDWSEIEIYFSKFNPDAHQYTYDSISAKNRDLICTIDGDNPWGTQGNLPSVQYDSISILHQNKIIKLPTMAFSDLFEPNSAQVFRTELGHLIYSCNSDGAGAYCVVWIVENMQYKGRVIGRPF